MSAALHFAASLGLGIPREQCGAGVGSPHCSAPLQAVEGTVCPEPAAVWLGKPGLGSTTAGDVACGRELSQSVTESPIRPGSRRWELARAPGRLLVHCWQRLAALWLPQRWGHGCSHCSRGLVSPKRRNVCWLLHQPWAEWPCLWQQGPGLCSAWGGVSPPYSLHPRQAVLALPLSLISSLRALML